MSNNDNIKCFLCPSKNTSLNINKAVQCTKCKAYFHASCANRSGYDSNGVMAACCGNRILSSTNHDQGISNAINRSSDLQETRNDDSDSNLDPADGADSLDGDLKILWLSICKRFNSLDNKIENNNQNIDKKIEELTSRIECMEKSSVTKTEDLLQEIKLRKMKEKNFVIYNIQDSRNPIAKDLQMVTALFENCDENPPFALNEIKLQRIGKKFQQGKNRPIRVILPSPECVHWVFSKKKTLGDGNINISSDQTKQQIDYYQTIKNDLQNRLAAGETNLTIKYLNGLPTIVSKPTDE